MKQFRVIIIKSGTGFDSTPVLHEVNTDGSYSSLIGHVTNTLENHPFTILFAGNLSECCRYMMETQAH